MRTVQVKVVCISAVSTILKKILKTVVPRLSSLKFHIKSIKQERLSVLLNWLKRKNLRESLSFVMSQIKKGCVLLLI